MSEAIANVEFHKEGEAMSLAIYSTPATRGDDIKVSLLFGALFPFFFAAALLRRLATMFFMHDATSRSVIGEARENTSLAVSYTLMARATLQSFARE